MFKLHLKTRYVETDQGGIVHNSAYIVYLENARIDFLQSIGLDINELEKGGVQCPVVSQSVKYLKPLFSLQEIEVHVWIESYSKVRFVLGYEILRGKDKILIGQSEHCFLDQNFKPRSLSEEMAKIFKAQVTTCLRFNT
jgi:acyl-CoA thioester hydrolase